MLHSLALVYVCVEGPNLTASVIVNSFSCCWFCYVIFIATCPIQLQRERKDLLQCSLHIVGSTFDNWIGVEYPCTAWVPTSKSWHWLRQVMPEQNFYKYWAFSSSQPGDGKTEHFWIKCCTKLQVHMATPISHQQLVCTDSTSTFLTV